MSESVLIVRRISNSEEIHRVDLHGPKTERQVEKVLSGLLRNMNRDVFYVDDSEVQYRSGYSAIGRDS